MQGSNQVRYRCWSLHVSSVVLHPFCQCWASFVEGALTLRPKLTREKMHVNVKDVLRSQLCRACETMLLCFWSQSLQRAVALALLVGLLSVHLSWITDLLRELLRRCQKQAAVLQTSMPAVAAASKEIQTAPTSCLEQQYFLKFSWSSARFCSSQLGSRADTALPSKETPIKISAAW